VPGAAPLHVSSTVSTNECVSLLWNSFCCKRGTAEQVAMLVNWRQLTEKKSVDAPCLNHRLRGAADVLSRESFAACLTRDHNLLHRTWPCLALMPTLILTLVLNPNPQP
jgi:hypothetical protein